MTRSWTATSAGGMPVFFAAPDHVASSPCVIVVHERYGFVRHTRDLAQRFASDGFVAAAPDLYFAHPDQEALHRGDANCDVADPDALAALEAVIDMLTTIPQADASRLAVMGVCQTARLPLVVAATRPVGAALVWYGAAQLREWAVNGKYRRFRDCLERHRKSFSIHLYRDAPHGWLNDTMPGRYRRAQAEAAWADQRAFLKAALAPDYDRTIRVQRYAAEIAPDYDFGRNVRHE
jgi:carboxymethylenebutenolidase